VSLLQIKYTNRRTHEMEEEFKSVPGPCMGWPGWVDSLAKIIEKFGSLTCPPPPLPPRPTFPHPTTSNFLSRPLINIDTFIYLTVSGATIDGLSDHSEKYPQNLENIHNPLEGLRLTNSN
jgi:hypothetical protein